MNEFELHPQLSKDCGFILDLPLSRLLRMNDRNYPWLILVPRRPGIIEIIDLEHDAQQQLFKEILSISHILKTGIRPDKINIGALGNMVAQLHIHLVARFKEDAVWPKPVWGAIPALPFEGRDWEDELRYWRRLAAASSGV